MPARNVTMYSWQSWPARDSKEQMTCTEHGFVRTDSSTAFFDRQGRQSSTVSNQHQKRPRSPGAFQVSEEWLRALQALQIAECRSPWWGPHASESKVNNIWHGSGPAKSLKAAERMSAWLENRCLCPDEWNAANRPRNGGGGDGSNR